MMYAVSKGVYYVQVRTQKEPCIKIMHHADAGRLKHEENSKCLLKGFIALLVLVSFDLFS